MSPRDKVHRHVFPRDSFLGPNETGVKQRLHFRQTLLCESSPSQPWPKLLLRSSFQEFPNRPTGLCWKQRESYQKDRKQSPRAAFTPERRWQESYSSRNWLKPREREGAGSIYRSFPASWKSTLSSCSRGCWEIVTPGGEKTTPHSMHECEFTLS